MYAAVSRSASTSYFWSNRFARICGSRLLTSAKKTSTEVDAVVAAEVAGIAACKAPLKVSHPAFKRKREDLPLFTV